MIFHKCLLVIDYNNVRWSDVLTIRRYAQQRHGLQTVLIRKKADKRDYDVADHVFELDFASPDFVDKAARAFADNGLVIVGGFPFSDKAVAQGSRLLESLGVLADSAVLANAALSKAEYRKMEKRSSDILREHGVWIPETRNVTSVDDVRAFLASNPKGIILKPACEGNNRGVVRIDCAAEVDAAWRLARPFLSDGLIAETLIPFEAEFSFDGVQDLCFVTRKLSASGRYPVEMGQQVPSLLPSAAESRIKRVGRWVATATGSRVGAVHNEIRWDGRGGTAVVEPNRRPAGMQIWDLAEKAYGVSIYGLLVDSVVGLPLPAALPEPRGVAQIRMLAAPRNGVWNERGDSDESLLERITHAMRAEGVEIFQFRINKDPGDSVTTLVRNNADFIGHVCAYSNELGALEKGLTQFEKIWKRVAMTSISDDYDEVEAA